MTVLATTLCWAGRAPANPLLPKKLIGGQRIVAHLSCDRDRR